MFNLHAISQDSISIGSSEEGIVCSPIYSSDDCKTPASQFAVQANVPPVLSDKVLGAESAALKEPLHVTYAAEDYATPYMRPQTPSEVFSPCSYHSEDEARTPVECALVPFSLSAPKANDSMPTAGPVDFALHTSNDLRSKAKANHVTCESISVSLRAPVDSTMNIEPLHVAAYTAEDLRTPIFNPSTPSEFYLPDSYDEGNANEIALPAVSGAVIDLSGSRAVGDNEIRGSFTNYPNDCLLPNYSNSSSVDILKSSKPKSGSVSISDLLDQHESRMNENASTAAPGDVDDTDSVELSDLFNEVEMQARHARLTQLGFSDLI